MPTALHIFVVQVSMTTLIPACALFQFVSYKLSRQTRTAISQQMPFYETVALGFPYLRTAVHTEKSMVSITTDIIMAYENSFIPFRLLFCCILLWYFRISHFTFSIIFKL